MQLNVENELIISLMSHYFLRDQSFPQSTIHNLDLLVKFETFFFKCVSPPITRPANLIKRNKEIVFFSVSDLAFGENEI
jgi:hypothetical protein